MIKGKIHSLESFGTVDGPGVRFVVFLQGCPMRCLYCHNPDTWEITDGKLMAASEIITDYKRNEGFYKSGGITVTGGEPLLQMDFVTELFQAAKDEGIHTCIDTSGITFTPDNSEWLSRFDTLLDLTDVIMLDIKHIDPVKHKEITAQPNDRILAMAEYLSDKDIELWIRHVVVPNLTDDDDSLYRLGYFIGGIKSLKALDVLPYHDMGKVKYESLGMEYPLKDTPAMDKAKIVDKKQIILSGLRKKREEM